MAETTPSERRRVKNRQVILDAAREIVMKQGIDAFSMRGLAEKVDYSPAALYSYFASKEEILSALREEAQLLAGSLQQARLRPGMPVTEMFYQLGMSYLEFARAYPAHYLLTVTPAENELPTSLDDFLSRPENRGLMDLAEGAVASGQIDLPRGYQPIHLAFLTWFVAYGAAAIQNTVMRRCPDEFNQISDQVIRLLLDLF
jgi:AcrR family transcriptional regulator